MKHYQSLKFSLATNYKSMNFFIFIAIIHKLRPILCISCVGKKVFFINLILMQYFVNSCDGLFVLNWTFLPMFTPIFKNYVYNHANTSGCIPFFILFVLGFFHHVVFHSCRRGVQGGEDDRQEGKSTSTNCSKNYCYISSYEFFPPI